MNRIPRIAILIVLFMLSCTMSGTCNQCHFLSRSYRGAPDSCHDCHDDD